MLIDSSEIMQTIENTVCESVNVASGASAVTADDIYTGNGNIPYARATARNIAFDIMHNFCGFSYAVIAQRANFSRNAVVKCVCKSHRAKQYDQDYLSVYNDAVKRIVG